MCTHTFRTWGSCHQLISYSRVINITQERDEKAGCIYLDLKKPFDKVLHRRLPWKLEHIGGLKGTLKDRMEDYLKGREMKIVKDEKSEWREMKN